MEIFLFRGGYGGLSLVEDDIANLCLVVLRRVLRKAGGSDALLREINRDSLLMASRLYGAAALWPRPLAISPIPYGYVADTSKGAWLLGDQAAVIPSFTGDGMSIALHSGALAAKMCLAGSGPDEYLRTLSGQLQRGMKIATAVSRLMVSAPGQMLAPAVAAFLPPFLRRIAEATRIPSEARVKNCCLDLSGAAE
jgi:flavin-dependent dehydrogenase